jgi:hypothetical protein
LATVSAGEYKEYLASDHNTNEQEG